MTTKSSRLQWWGLALLLASALALRLWYSSWGTSPSRFYDERFSFENVASVLEQGRLQPANGYYPTLAYLPQTLLLAGVHTVSGWFGEEAMMVRAADGTFTPRSYRLSRGVQCLWGVASLFFVYLVGARAFNPAAGLAAALVLSVAPWHVHASGYFKPDALLLATVTLAFWLSLRAIQQPSYRSYALAGVGIALALGSKLTGGVVALPITLATLLRGRRQPRQLLYLVSAGLVSLVVYLTMNPHVRLYFHYLGRLTNEYEGTAQSYGGSRFEVFTSLVDMLQGSYVHGPWLAALVAIGGLMLLWRVLAAKQPNERRLPALMILSFLLAYPAAYALMTPHFKPNNLLPVVPFTSLLAGWALVSLGSWLGQRFPALQGRGLVSAAGVGLGLLFFVVPARYVYTSLIPTTEEVAHGYLRSKLRGMEGRLTFFEAIAPQPGRWEGSRIADSGVATVRVPGLHLLRSKRLGLSDGEMFQAHHLEGAERAFYENRLRRYSPRRQLRVTPRWFSVRGPELVVAVRPWYRMGEAVQLQLLPSTRPDRLDLELPLPSLPELPAPGGESRSWSLFFPGPTLQGGTPELWLDDRPLAMHWARQSGDSQLWTTERLPVEQAAGELQLRFAHPPGLEHRVAVAMHRWSRRRAPRSATSPDNTAEPVSTLPGPSAGQENSTNGTAGPIAGR